MRPAGCLIAFEGLDQSGKETQAKRLLERVAAFGGPPPIVVLTGGDPLRRPDIVALVGSVDIVQTAPAFHHREPVREGRGGPGSKCRLSVLDHGHEDPDSPSDLLAHCQKRPCGFPPCGCLSVLEHPL